MAVFGISSEGGVFAVRAQQGDVGGAGDLSAADNGNIIIALGDGKVVELADDGHGGLEVHDETPTRVMRSTGVVEAARMSLQISTPVCITVRNGPANESDSSCIVQAFLSSRKRVQIR